jgi:hypothetical protein
MTLFLREAQSPIECRSNGSVRCKSSASLLAVHCDPRAFGMSSPIRTFADVARINWMLTSKMLRRVVIADNIAVWRRALPVFLCCLSDRGRSMKVQRPCLLMKKKPGSPFGPPGFLNGRCSVATSTQWQRRTRRRLPSRV